MTNIQYPINIRPLSLEEGGGFLAEVPDLPGCMADGESIEEALQEIEDAIKAWIASATADGAYIPMPNSSKNFSGQFRLRVPKSLHARLAITAHDEDVSLNTFAITLLAEGLAKHTSNTGVNGSSRSSH